MKKRRHARFVRRLETEFSASGMNYRAISSDFSHSGLFIRTTHAFPPDTLIEMAIHLPNGSTSHLKGRVRRALKTTVAALKNGMGIELTEKDQQYEDFMRSFTSETDNTPGKSSAETGPTATAADTEKEPTPDSGFTPEFMIIQCPACRVNNKVRTARLSHGPKCGKCGASLSAT